MRPPGSLDPMGLGMPQTFGMPQPNFVQHHPQGAQGWSMQQQVKLIPSVSKKSESLFKLLSHLTFIFQFSVAGWWSDEFYSCCALCVCKCVRGPYKPSAAIISTAAGWEGQKLFGSATKAQGNGLVHKGSIEISFSRRFLCILINLYFFGQKPGSVSADSLIDDLLQKKETFTVKPQVSAAQAAKLAEKHSPMQLQVLMIVFKILEHVCSIFLNLCFFLLHSLCVLHFV